MKRLYGGRVDGIDVPQPRDYRSSFPVRHSEGLLIDGSGVYRLMEDGERERLE